MGLCAAKCSEENSGAPVVVAVVMAVVVAVVVAVVSPWLWFSRDRAMRCHIALCPDVYD